MAGYAAASKGRHLSAAKRAQPPASDGKDLSTAISQPQRVAGTRFPNPQRSTKRTKTLDQARTKIFTRGGYGSKPKRRFAQPLGRGSQSESICRKSLVERSSKRTLDRSGLEDNIKIKAAALPALFC